MKKNKVIDDSLVLPNKRMISDTGTNYIRHITSLSKKVYDSTNNFTLQYGSDIRESMDIFVPNNMVELLPVLFFIHGGYWLNGSKEMVSYLAEDVLKLPMIFVSVGYKLAPKYKFPVALNDCKLAIQKAYEILEEYGGNKNKIIVAGHSAGGNLAMMLLLQKHLYEIIGEDSLKLCTSVSGVFNIYDCPLEVRNSLIEKENDYINGSPLYSKVSGITTPILLILGTEDFPNIKRDHELMLAKLRYYNCDVHEIVISEEDHFGLTLKITKNNNPWIEFIKDKAYGV